MNEQNEIFYSVMLYSLSAFFTIAVNIVFYLRARKSALLTAFQNVQYMIIIWLFANALKKASPNDEVVWLWVVVQYLGVCMFGVIFLDFAYLYKNGRRVTYWLRMVGYSVSGAMYIMLFTNPIHGQFYRSYTLFESVPGPLFYMHTLWSYLLVTVAYMFIFSAIIRNKYTLSRSQAAITGMGLLLPAIVNLNYIFGYNTLISFDLTPIYLNMTIVVFGYSAYRYRFLDIKKFSGHQILNNIHEGIIIIDANDRMIYRNPIVQRTVDNYPEISKITDIEEFIKAIDNRVVDLSKHLQKIHNCMEQNLEGIQQEVDMTIAGCMRNFMLKMERLDDSAGDRIGYLIRLVEITQHKTVVMDVEEKNEALVRINRQLSENITAAKQLAIAKERSRISKEIHDILGHTMTVVISLLESASSNIKDDNNFAREKVGQSMEVIRSGLADLKQSMRKASVGFIEADVLSHDLGSLIDGFERSGIKVDYFYKKASVKLSNSVYDTVYRVCQEGLTNALKHGKANNVTVGLRFVERHIDLFIIDDGNGCSKMIKGNGIKGMENRVKDLAGYFSCGSPDGDGFNIHVTLPFEAH